MKCLIIVFFFNLPPNSGLSDTIILDIISNYLVLPNRITVPLVSEVQIAQLRFPVPKVSMCSSTLKTDWSNFSHTWVLWLPVFLLTTTLPCGSWCCKSGLSCLSLGGWVRAIWPKAFRDLGQFLHLRGTHRDLILQMSLQVVKDSGDNLFTASESIFCLCIRCTF